MKTIEQQREELGPRADMISPDASGADWPKHGRPDYEGTVSDADENVSDFAAAEMDPELRGATRRALSPHDQRRYERGTAND